MEEGRGTRRCAFLALLAAALLLPPAGAGALDEDGPDDSAPQKDYAVCYDEHLQALVYTRLEINCQWRPKKSANGFHISKFLSGQQLTDDVAQSVDNSILHAEPIERRKPLRFVVNYADGCCRDAQESNCISAIRKNAGVLRARRGSGFWVWKPYVLFKMMNELQDGDTLLYGEFAVTFNKDLGLVFDLPESMQQDVVFFEHPRGEEDGPRTWSKGDTLVILDCYNTSCLNEARHASAAFSLWKKSEESYLLATYWMTYMEDPRVATDMQDTLGFPNVMLRQGEAQETAVASIIAHKWGLQLAPKSSIEGYLSLNF